MATANEELFDALLRQQINLQRLSKGEARKVLSQLELADQELNGKLTARLMKTNGKMDFTSKQWTALRKEIGRTRKAVLDVVNKTTKHTMKNVAVLETNATVGMLQSAVPVELNFAAPNVGSVAAAAQQTPFGGANLMQNIAEWGVDLAEADGKRIRGAIQAGITNGEGVPQIMQRVQRAQQMTRNNAEAITRTAVNHASNTARDAVFQENADVIQALRWTSTLDGRTSAICRARDGHYDALEIGGDMENVPSPHISGSPRRPPGHVRCRSLMIAILNGQNIADSLPERAFVRDARTRRKREIDFRKDAKNKVGKEEWSQMTRKERTGAIRDVRRDWAEKNIGQVPGDMTYDEWLRKQPASFQDEVLGKAKAEGFRNGIKTDQYVDRNGNELTIDQMRAKSPTKMPAVDGAPQPSADTPAQIKAEKARQIEVNKAKADAALRKQDKVDVETTKRQRAEEVAQKKQETAKKASADAEKKKAASEKANAAVEKAKKAEAKAKAVKTKQAKAEAVKAKKAAVLEKKKLVAEKKKATLAKKKAKKAAAIEKKKQLLKKKQEVEIPKKKPDVEIPESQKLLKEAGVKNKMELAELEAKARADWRKEKNRLDSELGYSASGKKLKTKKKPTPEQAAKLDDLKQKYNKTKRDNKAYDKLNRQEKLELGAQRKLQAQEEAELLRKKTDTGDLSMEEEIELDTKTTRIKREGAPNDALSDNVHATQEVADQVKDLPEFADDRKLFAKGEKGKRLREQRAEKIRKEVQKIVPPGENPTKYREWVDSLSADDLERFTDWGREDYPDVYRSFQKGRPPRRNAARIANKLGKEEVERQVNRLEEMIETGPKFISEKDAVWRGATVDYDAYEALDGLKGKEWSDGALASATWNPNTASGFATLRARQHGRKAVVYKIIGINDGGALNITNLTSSAGELTHEAEVLLSGKLNYVIEDVQEIQNGSQRFKEVLLRVTD